MAAKKKAKRGLMDVRDMPIDDVIPYHRNPRKRAAVEKVANLIAEYGWRQPIVADENNIVIVGHTRLAAAHLLGLKIVPVEDGSDLSPVQVKGYRIADNRVHEDGSWDDEMLVLEMGELSEEGFDMSLTAFNGAEIERMLQKPADGNTDPDATPENAPERCTPGDLWVIGAHRLLCGDATSADDVGRLLDGATPLLTVTDPPYGVNYDPKWREEAAKDGRLTHGPRRTGEVPNDDRADWGAAWALAPGPVIYTWSAGGNLSIVAGMTLMDAGFEIRNQIIWSKRHFPVSRGHYTYRHEPCWYAVRKGSKAHWIGDKKQSTVWDVALDENVVGGHSTQKPVELFRRAIANHRGDVYEPFAGSGTCLVAAEQLGRSCHAMELDAKYCDVVLERLSQFMGTDPIRLGGPDGS